MSRINLFFCILGFTATFISTAKARLSGEGIVGGEDAKKGEYPYQVSLEVYGFSICGGSIISERYVVTAAHCVTNSDGSLRKLPITVVAGIIDIEDASERITVEVDKVFVPWEYAFRNPFVRSTGDIAVLKLSEDLDLESYPHISKVDLPERDEMYAGKKAVISGFGWNKVDLVVDSKTGQRSEKNGVRFKKMRYAETNVLSQDDCQRHYNSLTKSKHICAAVTQRDPQSPEGVCSGDSGGPLVYNGALIGVLSTSPLGCVENKKPAVYTRVTGFLDFIEKVVDGKEDYSIQSITLSTED